MPNYYSKTLKRTFAVVYFSGSVEVNGSAPVRLAAGGDLPKGHPPTDRLTAPAAINLTGIKRAENGLTIAEIFAAKAKLAGRTVVVRGRVVKYNPMIMGKNWLHLRDGSGAEGANDLTVTSATPVKVGDLVVISGVLYANRDFGAGYQYGVIVENADVTVEP